MSTKRLVIAQKYTPDKYDKVYLRLERIMEHPRQVSRFRSELAKAIARGFPIDYKYIYTNSIYPNGSSSCLLGVSFSCDHNFTRALLDFGADVNIEDCNGMNALTSVAFKHFIDSLDYGISTVPPYFAEIIQKTRDIDKKIGTTALGYLCRAYCIAPSQSVLNIIKKLLSDGSDIKAAGDWLTWDSNYSKAHKKEFLAAGKKLKNYISLYNQQKENLREKPDSAIFEYEL